VTNLFGVAVDGKPVAGVINQPWAPGFPKGRTIWGGPGAGCQGIEPIATEPLMVVGVVVLHPGYVVVFECSIGFASIVYTLRTANGGTGAP